MSQRRHDNGECGAPASNLFHVVGRSYSVAVEAPASVIITTEASARRERRRLYLPVVVLGAATAWLAWAGARLLQRDASLGRSLGGAWYELAGPSVVAFLVVALLCERRWPVERRPLLARGHIHDACFFVLSTLIVVPLVTFLGVASAALIAAHGGWLVWQPAWPRPVVVVVALVAMDAANWVTHLGEHKLMPLWRVHAVHHSQEELSVLTTFRAHPLVHTASFFAATVPVIALTGVHPLAPVLITTYLCLGALPHANVPWTFGPLGKVVISPAYHRLHHDVAGPGDINLGIVLPWWDMLAGRAVWPVAGAPPVGTGLAGRPLPVEQSLSLGVGQTLGLLGRQLAEPFSRGGRRRSASPADRDVPGRRGEHDGRRG